MIVSNANAIKPTAQSGFMPVSLSLAEICGEAPLRCLCENQAFLTGDDPAPLHQLAAERVGFFPSSFERRLLELLPLTGQKVGPEITTNRGATSGEFEKHSKLPSAPLGALGYFRVGENGKLYLISKSEHYHAPLGHGFPGYRLIEHARRLGIPNATHNNTRGFITRRLESELVRKANGIGPDDHEGWNAALRSADPETPNRVLNLETGSLAVEAALKMVLARFYRPEGTSPAPKYSGRTPVLLVVGNDDQEFKANYHGTTMLTQVMRGMWPELYRCLEEQAVRVAAVRPNSIPDLEAAFACHEKPPAKIAGFFHEIVMMNYGGRLLSRDFLRRAYELCRAHDVPAVADEIQSCLWAPDLFLFRDYGLRPSFVALGKGFPGGEFPASRLLFSTAFDCLPQFGALVTNGQEELAALAYLVTMRWAEANRETTSAVGAEYYGKVQELAARWPGLIQAVDGYRHMTCLRFADKSSAVRFAQLLVEAGLDISAQTYKADCPPAVLTKLPLIAGPEVVAWVVERMRQALIAMAEPRR